MRVCGEGAQEIETLEKGAMFERLSGKGDCDVVSLAEILDGVVDGLADHSAAICDGGGVFVDGEGMDGGKAIKPMVGGPFLAVCMVDFEETGTVAVVGEIG